MVKTDRNSAEDFCHPPGAVCPVPYKTYSTKFVGAIIILSPVIGETASVKKINRWSGHKIPFNLRIP